LETKPGLSLLVHIKAPAHTTWGLFGTEDYKTEERKKNAGMEKERMGKTED